MKFDDGGVTATLYMAAFILHTTLLGICVGAGALVAGVASDVIVNINR